jgi:hypothetical protein
MAFLLAFSAALTAPVLSRAADAPPVSVKLPYAKGQSFVVTQGYNTPPTHIKKDSYALDLTQNGCDAYGKLAVAAAAGKVMFASEEGYNGGYGTELIIDHGNNVVSRYAHMIPGSITITASGTPIRRGQTIGLIGDTGLVAGLACAVHPGTHLHFAMDTVNSDGTFSAYNPEPISGYTDVAAGKWYLSDNGDDDAAATATADAAPADDISAPSSNATIATTTNSIVPAPASSSAPSVMNNLAPAGGVSITPATVSAPSISTQASTTVSTPPTVATSTVDAADATSTSTPSNDATSTPSTPVTAATGTLFSQLDDSANSNGSWYDDNWFYLGNGFAGTLTTLTLKGKVSDVDYLASQVFLQEFKDKNYTVLVQEFPISGNAPFTPTMATTTFAGLSIPLKPYFYYRLITVQDWQNRSVILAGTTTTTTGTTMWNNFIYGIGRVESTGPFFPFMVMEGTFATSTLTPPPLTTPTNLAERFDELGMQLDLSWSTSTDPDWPANPLHYEMNYSTSTSFAGFGWSAAGSIPVVAGNSYLIGLRAADNYGDVSAAVTTTWNFPPGFTPYELSPSLGYAYQYFTVPSTSTLESIALFTTDVQTSARYLESVGCSLQLFDEYNLSSVGVTPSDNGFGGSGCGGTPTFSFASSSLMLYPDHRYHWVFTAQTGNPSTGASVQFYGTAVDTAGGAFSDPSLANAKFTVTGDTGVLFSN